MRVALYLALIVLATVLALWRGTAGEKWITSIVLCGSLLTIPLVGRGGSSFASVSLMFMLLDGFVAFLLCLVAVRYPCWVAILVAAFQINSALGHVVKLLAPHTIPFSYAFLLRVWAWPMVFAMLLSRALPQLRAIIKAKDWPPLIRGGSS